MPLQKSHFGQFDAGRSHSDPGQNCAPNSSRLNPDIASGHAEPAGAPIPGRCGEGQSAIAGGLPATGAILLTSKIFHHSYLCKFTFLGLLL
jgi:hypothetical protein